EDRQGAARLGGQGDRRHRQAEGHPLRRQPAQDALREDHAPPAALDRQGRGDHPGRVDARESGDSGAAEAAVVAAGPARPGTRTRCTLQSALAATVEATERHQATLVYAGGGAPSTMRSTWLRRANSTSVSAAFAASI